jgi:hypothetical protein
MAIRSLFRRAHSQALSRLIVEPIYSPGCCDAIRAMFPTKKCLGAARTRRASSPLLFAARGRVLLYVAAQLSGALVGVMAAHAMFELPLVQVSLKARTGLAQGFAEFIATFGLLLTIFGCAARRPLAAPYAIGLYITAAYWFTASMSFANPAVTIARSLSNTFAGIAPSGVAAFILAQFAGALAAAALARWLWSTDRNAGGGMIKQSVCRPGSSGTG